MIRYLAQIVFCWWSFHATYNPLIIITTILIIRCILLRSLQRNRISRNNELKIREKRNSSRLSHNIFPGRGIEWNHIMLTMFHRKILDQNIKRAQKIVRMSSRIEGKRRGKRGFIHNRKYMKILMFVIRMRKEMQLPLAPTQCNYVLRWTTEAGPQRGGTIKKVADSRLIARMRFMISYLRKHRRKILIFIRMTKKNSKILSSWTWFRIFRCLYKIHAEGIHDSSRLCDSLYCWSWYPDGRNDGYKISDSFHPGFATPQEGKKYKKSSLILWVGISRITRYYCTEVTFVRLYCLRKSLTSGGGSESTREE